MSGSECKTDRAQPLNEASLKNRDTRDSPCFNKIVIRGPNWVGDSVLAIPAMKAIRTQFPRAEITLLVRPWVAGLFTSAPFVDRVWTEPKPSSFGDWTRITRDIRLNAFDMAVVFPNSFESALMMFLGRVPERVGYARDGRAWMLTNMIWPSRREQHQVHYYLDLANAVSAVAETPSITIEASPAEKATAWDLLRAEGIPTGSRFMVLNPGAAYGSAKRWREDRFAEVGGRLAREFNLQIVIVGSEVERPIAEHIARLANSPAVVLNGKTSLETLIGVLAESSLMITNDSGPMHIAAALGTPTVAIFGSTDDVATGPYGPRTRVVRHPVECSPCMLRTCPIDHPCMRFVTSEDVCQAVRELLAYA
jgi:heptosyltransferase-2